MNIYSDVESLISDKGVFERWLQTLDENEVIGKYRGTKTYNCFSCPIAEFLTDSLPNHFFNVSSTNGAIYWNSFNSDNHPDETEHDGVIHMMSWIVEFVNNLDQICDDRDGLMRPTPIVCLNVLKNLV